MHIRAHKELRIWLQRLNNLLLNNVKPKFDANFVFLGTTSSFIEIISSSETETKREAILFLFGCSEVNSSLLITSELTNQNARKALFTCVVDTNWHYHLPKWIVKSGGYSLSGEVNIYHFSLTLR